MMAEDHERYGAGFADTGFADAGVADAAFAGASIGMLLADLETSRVLAVNAAMGHILGRDAAALSGADWRRLLPPSDRLIGWIAGGAGEAFLTETRCVRSDGVELWVLVSAAVAPASPGRPPLLIAQVVDLTARKQAEDDLAHRVLHDHLTRLPNRALFLDRTARALELARHRASGVAVLFLDLDRFKVINDSLGHEAGDQLLRSTAERLAEAISPTDTLARFAGDEFAILCEEVGSVEDAVGVAGRVLAGLARPLSLGVSEVVITASVGVALRSGDADADTLVHEADTAMYLAKERGRGRIEVFDEALRHRAVRRLETESGLRTAIEGGQLRLAYQPQIDVATGHLAGIEALVRWQHPDRGLLLPAEFLGVAEETGLVNDLGAWVLRQSSAQLARWRQAYPFMVEVGLAVNVSARQLSDPALIANVEAAVAAAGGGAPLCLEITETALLEAASPAGLTLRRLKTRGVLLGVDNFGTSYSSLANFTRLAPDFLKVDSSFVIGLGADPGASVIVGAVINMAHTLGLFVIAEGVESNLQACRLSELGCDLLQGFVVAKPLRSDEFERTMLAPGEACHLATGS